MQLTEIVLLLAADAQCAMRTHDLILIHFDRCTRKMHIEMANGTIKKGFIFLIRYLEFIGALIDRTGENH